MIVKIQRSDIANENLTQVSYTKPETVQISTQKLADQQQEQPHVQKIIKKYTIVKVNQSNSEKEKGINEQLKIQPQLKPQSAAKQPMTQEQNCIQIQPQETKRYNIRRRSSSVMQQPRDEQKNEITSRQPTPSPYKQQTLEDQYTEPPPFSNLTINIIVQYPSWQQLKHKQYEQQQQQLQVQQLQNYIMTVDEKEISKIAKPVITISQKSNSSMFRYRFRKYQQNSQDSQQSRQLILTDILHSEQFQQQTSQNQQNQQQKCVDVVNTAITTASRKVKFAKKSTWQQDKQNSNEQPQLIQQQTVKLEISQISTQSLVASPKNGTKITDLSKTSQNLSDLKYVPSESKTNTPPKIAANSNKPSMVSTISAPQSPNNSKFTKKPQQIPLQQLPNSISKNWKKSNQNQIKQVDNSQKRAVTQQRYEKPSLQRHLNLLNKNQGASISAKRLPSAYGLKPINKDKK